MLLFFFSSRRRHTRLVSDWSSDVCSSDLAGAPCQAVAQCTSSDPHIRTRALRVRLTRRTSGIKSGLVVARINSSTRSEERRVGKEWKARGSARQYKKKLYRARVECDTCVV